jgi:hypothetical protein
MTNTENNWGRLLSSSELDKLHDTNEDFVKCGGCEQEAVTMDNPDGIYLCQDCYDGCVLDMCPTCEGSGIKPVKGKSVLKPRDAAVREWIITGAVMLLAAFLLGLVVRAVETKSESEKAPFMRIEKILDTPEEK